MPQESHTLRVRLGAAYDGGAAWRSDVVVSQARAGWLVTGPRGLARRVAIAVGVPQVDRPEAMRVAAYATAMRRVDDGRRRFSRAFEADPLGVARHVLALRDGLLAHGWSGRPLGTSPRLADLSVIEAEVDAVVRSGDADVWRALVRRLVAGASAPPLAITLADPDAAFPTAFLTLLDALRARGASITRAEADRPLAPATTDLGRVQRHLLGELTSPLTGDGSWVVIEAETPAEAAGVTARWLREAPPADRQVVVGDHGATLDAALRAEGVPGLGVTDRSADRPALQVLPLRLAVRFDPPDPADALALVGLPGGPIGGPLRTHLAAALLRAPGVGGPEWNRAIAAAASDATQRVGPAGDNEHGDTPEGAHEPDFAAEAVYARARRWFGAPMARLPRAEVSATALDTLAWLQGRAAHAERERPDLLAAAAACGAFRRVIDALGADDLGRAEVWDAWRLAVGSGAVGGVAPAEAGRPWPVDDPGAVRACDEVLWWGFDATPAGPRPLAFSADEAAELREAGVSLPVPGADRAEEARRWRRALLAAKHRVVLTRWRTSLRETTSPHPLYDEIVHHPNPAWKPSLTACTFDAAQALARVDGVVAVGWNPTRIPRPEAQLPRPRPLWRLAGRPLRRRDRVSYTELDHLAECDLRWALQYVLGLQEPRVSRLPADQPMVGTFLHAILGDLLQEIGEHGDITTTEARSRVEAAFDRRLPLEAAVLARPEKDRIRAWSRDVAARAAARLVAIVHEGDWRVLGVELPLDGTFDGRALEGKIDVLLGGRGDERRAVLDLKLGKADVIERLRTGRALQLALYAGAVAAARPEGPPPQVAYFILSQQLFVGPEGFSPPGAIGEAGIGPADTLARAETYVHALQRGLDAGWLAATGRRDWRAAWGAAAPDLPPPNVSAPDCASCPYRTLCHPVVEGA